MTPYNQNIMRTLFLFSTNAFQSDMSGSQLEVQWKGNCMVVK